jgi:hypothetical protein
MMIRHWCWKIFWSWKFIQPKSFHCDKPNHHIWIITNGDFTASLSVICSAVILDGFTCEPLISGLGVEAISSAASIASCLLTYESEGSDNGLQLVRTIKANATEKTILQSPGRIWLNGNVLNG